MSNKTAPAGAKLEEVTLLKPHTHAGKKLAAGAKIRVNATDKQWLIDHKVIAGAPAAKE